MERIESIPQIILKMLTTSNKYGIILFKGCGKVRDSGLTKWEF